MNGKSSEIVKSQIMMVELHRLSEVWIPKCQHQSLLQEFRHYIRPHQGIGGLTPAQMANILINLLGNRWETMIGLAVK